MGEKKMHIGYWESQKERDHGKAKTYVGGQCTGWDGMDWIDLAEERDQWRALVNTAMNLRVPQNAGKFLSSCTTGGFSRRAQLHE
jgi:hypothetical protein